jgi:hypothetical protein
MREAKVIWNRISSVLVRIRAPFDFNLYRDKYQ